MVTMDGIVLGGGSGSRFLASSELPSRLPKQFQKLGAAPVLVHAVRSLFSMDCLRQVLVTAPASLQEETEEILHSYLPELKARIRVITGGAQRQDSSRLALEALDQDAPARVLIHDGCRPFLSTGFLARIRERLLDRSYGAWIPVVPITETLKRVENQLVLETVDRSKIVRVQTPQIFEYGVIRSLVEQAKALEGALFTDDASLCEYYGIPVGTFEGDVRNLKLTYQFELETLRSFLKDGSAKGETPSACEPESATTFTV
jgi:2-C-methyl-D-erythritol 4-phosphate cytidylyltransferase / 2-C-methyl-D-erythritol 2,4-cyclodiphosphate synthase